MLKTRTWIIVILFLLTGSAAASLFAAGKTAEGTTANIYLDGNCIRSIDLSSVVEGYSFEVEGPCGMNRITVEHGRICVERGDCPDQICVHQGWISNSAAPIVCLPNKLVVQVVGGGEQNNQLDGVS